MISVSGIEKAALVIMTMTQERAAEVMRHFNESEVEELAAEIMKLRSVDPAVADAAIAEFHARVRSSHGRTRGGRDAAASLLEASFGADKAADLLTKVATVVAGSPFEFLEGVEASTIAHQIEHELTPTIAMVLAHLSAEKAAAVFGSFALTRRTVLAQAIATLHPVDPASVEAAAEAMRSLARSSSKPAPRDQAGVSGGVKPLVAIISRADVAAEHALLEALDVKDPALANEVRSHMLGFADIVRFQGRDVQAVIRGIDASVLAAAIKSADDDIVATIRANMSERNRELLDAELELVGKQRKTDIIEAQAPLIKAMRELAASGALVFVGDDDDESAAAHDPADEAAPAGADHV